MQSGFGRTGEWFAINDYKVVPDILIMAKGIASGMPLSGIAGKPHLFEKSAPGRSVCMLCYPVLFRVHTLLLMLDAPLLLCSMGGTYGGNSVSAAAANATIDVILVCLHLLQPAAFQHSTAHGYGYGHGLSSHLLHVLRSSSVRICLATPRPVAPSSWPV